MFERTNDSDSKLDVTISNWCTSEEKITITLACSLTAALSFNPHFSPLDAPRARQVLAQLGTAASK